MKRYWSFHFLSLCPISETQIQQQTPSAVYPPRLPGAAGLQIQSTSDTASRGFGVESSDRELPICTLRDSALWHVDFGCKKNSNEWGKTRGKQRVSLPFDNFELHSILGCGCFGENEGETSIFNVGDMLNCSTEDFPHLTCMSVLIYFVFIIAYLLLFSSYRANSWNQMDFCHFELESVVWNELRPDVGANLKVLRIIQIYILQSCISQLVEKRRKVFERRTCAKKCRVTVQISPWCSVTQADQVVHSAFHPYQTPCTT